MSREHFQVIIVGAGPVGLLLGNILGLYGVRCLILERKSERSHASMAIGVTPPSLGILQKLGLSEAMVAGGVTVNQARVHEAGRFVGEVSFHSLEGDFPFILSIPQWRTIEILRGNLVEFPHVKLMEGMEVEGIESGEDGAWVIARSHQGTEVFSADFVAGCDGLKSTVRDLAGIGLKRKDYGCRFVMADFKDRTGYASDAYLFFGPEGSVESFPLPGGERRWICQVLEGKQEASDVEMLVRRRCGIELGGSRISDYSFFSPHWMLCRQYFHGRVVLCGDAAHVMSPIGGQGMNTGFADAELLGFVLQSIINQGAEADSLFRLYNSVRRRAFRVAAGRAERGMWLGTRRGRLASNLRGLFIRTFLIGLGTVRERLPAYFAMQTIPYNRLAKVPEISQCISRYQAVSG